MNTNTDACIGQRASASASVGEILSMLLGTGVTASAGAVPNLGSNS